MRSNRRAFSLVELMVSLAAMSVLMGGLAVAVTIAGSAIPDPDSALSNQLDAFHGVEQIASELGTATLVTAKSSKMIEFKVADRNGDSNLETIRYEWSGASGASLTRKYNTDAPIVVTADVREFELRYGVRAVIENIIQTVPTQTPESVLASFSGWTGYSATALSKAASLSAWVSEYFTITPPSGATSLTFTKAEVRLKGSTLLPSPGATVAMHRSKNSGTNVPDTPSIGLPVTVLPTSLTTAFQPIIVNFAGVVVPDPGRTDYCLVVKGTATTSAWVDCYYNSSAPDNGMVEMFTSNSGANWNPPPSDINKQDIRFTVWGYFTTGSSGTVEITQQLLTSSRITLRVGPLSSTRVETSVQILNQPEVTGL